MRVVAIIPARMNSSRFPGKPLAKILDVPLIGHVYMRARMFGEFADVYVATCDKEIFDYVESIGGKAIMTSSSHDNCIDRIVEAQHLIDKQSGSVCDVIALVQGDEPLIEPEVLAVALQALKVDSTLPIANIMAPIHDIDEFRDINVVKVVVNRNLEALYFSREAIPSIQKGVKGPWLKQTGIIFFRREALAEYCELPKQRLEACEYVDMLRFLEVGKKVKMIFTEAQCLSVDTPEDKLKVESVMRTDRYYAMYRDQGKIT